MFNIKKSKKGFTLIELLVVIAIIGVLASVVLASLNTARRKSRDARRLADIKQIQVALELYFDANGEYPDAVNDLEGTNACGTANRCMPQVPEDPVGQTAYPYDSYTTSTNPPVAADDCDEATETCVSYHLGAALEEDTNPALDGDIDADGNTIDGQADTAAAPSNSACVATAGATRYCYDVRP